MGRTNGFIWVFSIIVHLELAVIAGALLRGQEPKHPSPDPPDPHCVLSKPIFRVPLEVPSDKMFGQLPISCDHRFILQISDDRLGDGLRCGGCGWPWWVIRARSW
jgi:hypothetical protein